MINNVVLVGRLTRDPMVRKTAAGRSVLSFTLAVEEVPIRTLTSQRQISLAVSPGIR